MRSKLFARSTSVLLLFTGALAGIVAARNVAAQTFIPAPVATSSSTTPYSGLTQTQAVDVDASGNIFFSQPASGELVEQPANGGAQITLYTLPSGSGGYPKGVAVDHVGNAYTTDYSGNLWEVPIAGGTATNILSACGPIDGYYLGTDTVAVDGSNNVYAAGDNESSIFKITQAGVCSIVATGDETSYVAADGAGNLFYSVSTNGLELYEVPVGSTTPVKINGTFSAINGLRADSFGNLFVTDANTIDELPYVNGAVDATLQFSVLPSSSASSVGVGATGILYTTIGSSISLNTLGSVSFTATAVDSQSSVATVSLLFNSTETLSSLQFTSGASTTAELANTGAGSCAIGTSYTAGNSCTLTLAVTPSGLGARNDSVQLLSGTTVIGSVTVSVQGSGAGLTVDPGTQNNLGSSWTAPDGVAVDAAGNVFVADESAGTVSYIAAGSATPTVIASGLSSPNGVAVAADGSVYVANTGAATLVKIPRANGAYTTATTVVGGLTTPTGVVVAGNGDVYLTDAGAAKVYRFPNEAGVVDFYDMQSYGSGFTAPAGIAIDVSGNLYVTDQSAGNVVELTSGSTQSTIVSGLTSPVGIAVGPNESLYIAQTGSTTIELVPYVSGAYSLNATSKLGSGFQAPVSVAADTAGNLYVADQAAPAVIQIARSNGLLNLGEVNEGESSAIESLTLSDAGNLELTLGSPLESANGDTVDFSIDTAGSTTCSAGSSLSSGSTCILPATFIPTTTGTLTDVLTFTSNAVNATPITGTLSGVGTNLPNTTTTLTQITAGPISYGETVNISAVVAVQSGTGTPNGNIQFYVNGTSYGSAVAINSGTANASISGLPAGSDTISATYTGNSTYAGSSAQALTINVSLASTVTTLTSSANSSTPVPPGTSVTLTATIGSSVASAMPSGTVTFFTGSTVIGTAPVNTTGVATLTSTTLPQGTYPITATYSGDSGFAASTSNIVTISIQPPQYVVSSLPTSLTVATPGSIATSFVVTPISGYIGGVDMQCDGLPANTSCTFVPATVYFINTTNSSDATVKPSAQTVALTITTNKAPESTVAGWMLPFGGFGLFVLARRRRYMLVLKRLSLFTIAVILLGFGGLLSLQGCGNASSPTPAGSSTVTLKFTGTPTGTSITVPANGTENIMQSYTFNLTVQ